MTTYFVTAITGEGKTFSDRVTEATPGQARKSFKEIYRHGTPYTITSVDVVCDHALATREQERKALEAIRKMVSELGPQSYLATAFEGCFEDAENNIENDFGDSMKARWLHADAQLKAANGTIEELKEQLEESQKDYEAACAAAREMAEKKNAEIKTLQERVLSENDLTDCRQMAECFIEELRRKVKKAEATILEYAECPESTTFCNAVKERKTLTSDIDYYTSLAESLTVIQNHETN